jgi:hypothetical protein
MATTLHYNFATVNQEDGVQTVGFADDQFAPSQYLLFQRSLDKDLEGETDEIYIERNGQSQGIYGGVERLVLSRDHAFLLFSSETAVAIGTEQEVNILFSVTDEEYQWLKAELEVIFGIFFSTL